MQKKGGGEENCIFFNFNFCTRVKVRKYKNNKHVLKIERTESTDICVKMNEVSFAVYDHTLTAKDRFSTRVFLDYNILDNQKIECTCQN